MFESKIQIHDLSKASRRDWEMSIINTSSGLMLDSLGHLSNPSQYPDFKFPINRDSAEYQVFSQIYGQEKYLAGQDKDELSFDYLDRKRILYVRLAEDLKRKRNYGFIPHLDRVLREKDGEIPDLTHHILQFGIYTLYLMACEPTRFLVGTKGGNVWKKIQIPKYQDELLPNVFGIATTQVRLLDLIGHREVEVVPERPIDLRNFDKVRLPKPISPLEELLEDAYMRQRYLVPPEGAEIRFRKAGDLRSMILLQSGDWLLSRMDTLYGDQLVLVNLETGEWSGPDIYTSKLRNEQEKPLWSSIVAETYRDLVTANERYVTSSYRSLRQTDSKGEVASDLFRISDDPQVIYIPRTIRIRTTSPEPRVPYDGPPRPVRPHAVIGHIRHNTEITPEHLKELRDLEKEWDMKFVDKIPPNCTLVRPYFSPKGSESNIKYFPVFIKRRIETELQEGLVRHIKIEPSDGGN